MATIDDANRTAVQRLLESTPVLTGIGRAADVIPGIRPNLILHAGPPIAWARMCGAQRGAIMAMALFEGWAGSIEEATRR